MKNHFDFGRHDHRQSPRSRPTAGLRGLLSRAVFARRRGRVMSTSNPIPHRFIHRYPAARFRTDKFIRGMWAVNFALALTGCAWMATEESLVGVAVFSLGAVCVIVCANLDARRAM